MGHARSGNAQEFRGILERNCSVAISEKDFRELSTLVAGIKATLDVWKWIVAGFSGAAFTAGLGALAWCWHLGVIVAVLQTGGNSQLLAELKTPKSPEQLRANLTTVTAQIETVRANGVKPSTRKITDLSEALSHVVRNNPELEETWQATAQLVSLKSDLLNPEAGKLKPCDTSHAVPEQRYQAVRDGQWELRAGYFYSHCTLDLEYLPAQDKKGTFHMDIIDDGSSKTDRKLHGKPLQIEPSDTYLQLPIFLENGTVVYHGGAIPFGNFQFEFRNCRLDFSVHGVPSKPVQDLLNAGLTENDNILSVGIAT